MPVDTENAVDAVRVTQPVQSQGGFGCQGGVLTGELIGIEILRLAGHQGGADGIIVGAAQWGDGPGITSATQPFDRRQFGLGFAHGRQQLRNCFRRARGAKEHERGVAVLAIWVESPSPLDQTGPPVQFGIRDEDG